MKKTLLFLILTFLLIGCVYAGQNVEINDVSFEIPSKYSGGDFENGCYELEDTFSIRCVDNNTAKAIGLWAVESDHSEDLNIDGHTVRHFCQYNEYVHGNQSHLYFASGNSVYEIEWTGEQIDEDIEKLIKSTPPSEIEDDAFYNALDKSLEIYKQEKIDKLNKDSEYNNLEARYNSLSDNQKRDDTRLKEILLTYYF